MQLIGDPLPAALRSAAPIGMGLRRGLRVALAALAALGLNSNAVAQLPAQGLAHGLVQGVLGIALSPAPGQLPALRAGGGVALQLEQVQLDGQTWVHLLASDGRHGWTPKTFDLPLPVTARARAGGSELLPLPPGHPDFPSAVGKPVPEGAAGRLVGGSRDSHVADAYDLQIPAWLNAGLGPWPRWVMGDVEGYAPVSQVLLGWPAKNSDRLPAGASTREFLGGWGLHGLSREPFLAPLAPLLLRLAPAEGTHSLDLSEAPGKVTGQSVLHGAWQGPLCAYRAASAPAPASASASAPAPAPAAPAEGLSALLCFARGKARAFVLQGTSGASVVAHADDDALTIARIEEADIDRDGLPEWLLEVVGVYGHGYYSELWIIDGRSTQAGLRIQRHVLSRSGETPETAQDAAWWVDRNRALWLWRSTPKGSRLTEQRYRRGGAAASLGTSSTRTSALVVLGSDTSSVAANQRLMQAQAAVPDAVVIPHQTRSGLLWITAVRASGSAQARRWAAAHGLPATAVRPLPWGR